MGSGFTYVAAGRQVRFGVGALDQLADAVDGFGWQRLMLCTIPRFRASGLATRIESLLGQRLVASYDQARPHVPQGQVDDAVALAIEHKVDALIGLGGGSPIGLAKAVSLTLATRLYGESRPDKSPVELSKVAVVAIPTTYAGSEMTPIYGVTQTDGAITRKVTVSDARATPRLALYDPELTLPLPSQMTASSGINALAHCIEAVYSISRNPLASAAALQGISHITQSLPKAVADGTDINARTELLTGAFLAATAISMAKIGLHHGLCHVLGGTTGVPHGVANGIMLPHAMRFNADATAPELASVARVMGLDDQDEVVLAEKAAQAVFDLIAGIGLPQRLRDVGVAEGDLPQLARVALNSRAVQNNPKPISNATQTETVFRAAW